MSRSRGVLLTVGLLLSTGCRPRQAGSVRIEPGLATLVPAGTTLLAGVRVDELRKTAVYRKYGAREKLPQLDDFVRRTGLDPRQDIWELLAASNGKDFVVMAHGKFGPAGLEPELEKAGAKRSSYRGYTLTGSDEMALMFMNTSVAVAGRPASLRSILDKRDSGGGRLPPALAERIKAVPAQSQIWVAALGPLPSFDVPLSKGSSFSLPAQMLQAIEGVTASADFKAGIDLAGVITSRTDQNAKQVHDMLRGLIGMGRLTTPDNQPDLLRFYDGIQVEQQQRIVRVRVQTPPELLDKLIDRLPSHKPRS